MPAPTMRYTATMVSMSERLTYVEGFAVPADVGFECHHAWCLDAEGRVIDSTWQTPGRAYFGVAFDTAYVSDRYEAKVAKFATVDSLIIESWDDDHALLKGNETRPWKAQVAATC